MEHVEPMLTGSISTVLRASLNGSITPTRSSPSATTTSTSRLNTRESARLTFTPSREVSTAASSREEETELGLISFVGAQAGATFSTRKSSVTK